MSFVVIDCIKLYSGEFCCSERDLSGQGLVDFNVSIERGRGRERERVSGAKYIHCFLKIFNLLFVHSGLFKKGLCW